MNQVSRPLLAVLAAAVVSFGVWMVALRPHGQSSSSGTTTAAAQAPPQPAPPKPVARPIALPRTTHRAREATRVKAGRRASADRLGAVERALARGKVLALLFYNPSGADDQAVKQELASLTTAGGMVFKLAIPLAEASSYAQLTNEVPVNFSPTLVIIDRARQAQEIVGFADTFEIIQRLNDALSTSASAG